MVELEESRRTMTTAASAVAAHVGDGTDLSPTSMLNNVEAWAAGVAQHVLHAMTVSTEEIALLGLAGQTFAGPGEVPETELLRSCIAVVELERGGSHVIAASLASTTARRDQFGLPLPPLLLLVTVGLRVSAATPVLP